MAAEDMHGFAGQLLRDEPMSRHTSWRVGGVVDTWFRPASLDELVEFMQTLEATVPVYWVGLGSNLLVRDGGVRGVIISVQDALSGVEDLGAGRVKAGAGLACTVFARHCVRRGLGPAEFFAGIPGTIGGALAMNAGAFGGETWEVVESVETIDRSGTLRSRRPDEYTVTYRQVDGPQNEWFVSGTFLFKENFATSMENMKSLVNERKEKQPLGLPSCGSVFRNPPDDHAARLIETAGLKGYEMGGAVVSDKHANFIINKGEATAADIEALITHVQTTVRDQHGVELKCEVHIIGEALND
ncbi:MAG: UDP-N-acetylmuramate dehydrogenase [Gammaproteobacteria bacterium]